MLPDVHGLIVTDDDARVLFELRGRAVFNEEGTRGGQNLVGSFEAEDERYAWLNDSVCIAEGTILTDPYRIETHVYAGINELIG
jgi:hypothetical protein